MGRPINKRWFGTTGTGTGTGLYTGNNLPIRFKTDGAVIEGYIVAQKGSKTFLCSDSGSYSPPIGNVKCRLTNAVIPASNGDASLVGIVTGGGAVTIRKLTNRVATDYNGVRYTWNLSDDSTETLIRLTAI